MYYVEIRRSVRRRWKIQLVPLETVDSYTGFRSVYAFTEDTKELIESQGNTRNIKGCIVYSDMLFVDFDDQPEAAECLLKLIQDNNLNYGLYDSGNRSFHFHIPIEPMEGVDVPQCQKAFMQRVAPKSDLSIYKHTGMYRLNNTWHGKNIGHKKRLLEKYSDGNILCIKDKPIITYDPAISIEYSSEEAAEYLDMLLLDECDSGGRRPMMFKLTALCLESGLTEGETLSKLWEWNINMCNPPHKHDVFERYIRATYKQLLRR